MTTSMVANSRLLLITTKLDATGQRWIAFLSDYNFSIKYRNGRKNADADGLSRSLGDAKQDSVIFPKVLKAIAHSQTTRVEECPLAESTVISDSPASVPSWMPDVIPEQLLQAHGLTANDWRKSQMDDTTLHFIISRVETGSRIPAKRTLDPTFDVRFLKEWDVVSVRWHPPS